MDRRDSPAGLTEAVFTDSVPDRVIFAVRGSLIVRSVSIDLDLLCVDGIAEAADGTPVNRCRVTEVS